MKKLFISQPMNGKSNEEIKSVRELAIKSAQELLGEKVEVIDSFFENAPHDAKPLWYLGKSLELLATADIAYFAEGWSMARGCKIEHKCAVDYGITCIEAPGSIDFGTALELAISGKKIYRSGWNGKNMFVVYQKGYPDGIPCNKQTADAWGMSEGDLFKCNPYLQIKCADGSHSMWVPSINDILAKDWFYLK